MASFRPGCLRLVAVRVGFSAVGFVLGVFPLLSQQQPAPQPPKPPNPFETVPQAPTQPAPPKPQAPGVPNAAPPDIVQEVNFQGARRVPQDTLRALVFVKRGDPYNRDDLRRDVAALWNSGRFDDIQIQEEPAETGWIITFKVVERSVVRTINYDGLKSITLSEVADRFKERHVTLTSESTYDRNRVQQARIVLQEYLAERGRQFAKVDVQLKQIPPSALEIVFKVDEGPKVQVGEIKFEGNTVFSPTVLRRSMRNLRPIGIPNSIFLENLFPKTYDSSKLEDDEQMITQYYQKNGYFLAHVTGQNATIVDGGGGKFRLPLLMTGRPVKQANISIALEEGRQYHLNKITFNGVETIPASPTS